MVHEVETLGHKDSVGTVMVQCMGRNHFIGEMVHHHHHVAEVIIDRDHSVMTMVVVGMAQRDDQITMILVTGQKIGIDDCNIFISVSFHSNFITIYGKG